MHQSEDAIVVGWETALRISLAITAGEAGSKKPFDWVGALHSYLAAVFVFSKKENCRGTAFKDIDTGQTLRHFPYKSDDYSN